MQFTRIFRFHQSPRVKAYLLTSRILRVSTFPSSIYSLHKGKRFITFAKPSGDLADKITRLESHRTGLGHDEQKTACSPDPPNTLEELRQELQV
ncbi:hypothetical protein ABEB36_013545 [Hypothenemus hampei]|uniref:Uncharacterized protein n=1 Tax=Hypothenemus hampei TaxID=57062 RepID=A0ABD1E924_HYPHA